MGCFTASLKRSHREYPDLKSDHMIIDIGAARLAAQPEMLDMIVTLNLYGDILSDIAAQVAGSIGLAGSANVGNDAAMFEAVHGSAPDIAGRDIANPSGLLNAAIQMLVHVGLPEDAERIKNAWLVTLEDGIHTPDMHREGFSTRLSARAPLPMRSSSDSASARVFAENQVFSGPFGAKTARFPP